VLESVLQAGSIRLLRSGCTEGKLRDPVRDRLEARQQVVAGE
jgi:hypothetical protein